MTRTFFQKFPLFTFLTAYFIVCLLSLLPYPARANPPPLGIHKASSYLFTRSLTASSSLFFFSFPFVSVCHSGGSPGWRTAGTRQGFTLQQGDTWKPRLLSDLGRDQEELVCPFVSSLPSSHPPPLLLSSPPLR